MALPLPTTVADPRSQDNFDEIALQFPLGPQQLQAPHAARVRSTSNQSIPDNTVTAITFDAERYDIGGLHSTSANTSRLTCVIPGLYYIFGHVAFAQNTADSGTSASIYLDGTTYLAIQSVVNTAAAAYASPNTTYALTAGQYVELVAYHNSSDASATNALTGAAFGSEFGMTYIGRTS